MRLRHAWDSEGWEIVRFITEKTHATVVRRVLPRPPLINGKGPLARAAELRPANFRELEMQEQWDIDKRLGILDWDGDPEK